MSGQPVRNPADINRFRDKYMDTLKMQEDINQMNLQANKTYLLTGQLPPQSQMQDTRTTAEKLADIEKLKQDIASNLKPIAEPQFSYAIVSKLMQEPLNANNSLIRFMAQRVSSIVEQLKKILPYGITGDANDLDRIVEYIKNMYSETQSKFMTTKSYMNSISSGSSSSKIISANDIDNVLTQMTDVIKQISIIVQRGINAGFVNLYPRAMRIIEALKDIKDTLPTTQELELFMQDIENPATNTMVSRSELDAIFKLLEKLPKHNEITALINKTKQYISSNNDRATEDALNRLLNLFGFLNDPNFNNLKTTFQGVKGVQRAKINQMEALQATQERQMIRAQDEAERDQSKAQKVYIINPADDAVYIRNTGVLDDLQQGATQSLASMATGAMAGMAQQQLSRDIPNFEDFQEELKDLLPSSSNENFDDYEIPLQIGSKYVSEYVPGDVYTLKQFKKDKNGKMIYILTSDKGDTIDLHKSEFDRAFVPIKGSMYEGSETEPFNYKNYNLHDGMYAGKEGEPINYLNMVSPKGMYEGVDIEPYNYRPPRFNFEQPIGYGIKRRGRPRGAGVTAVKPPNFVGFGINEINRKNLEKGVLTVRRNTRTNYPDMPSRHISQNLRNVIKTMIGGGAPKYEELGKLDNDEKEYLYKLVSRSNMDDKLSVPAPSKDQQEKDIHNFEVMKGQILSGNDSVDMVKKFKLLIRKLARQGLLPKADVEDMMDVLTDLGY